MATKRELSMDIMLNIIVMVLFYGFFITPVLILTDIGAALLLAMVVGGFICLFIARRVIKHVVPMFFAHIILPFAAWFLATGLVNTIAYLIIAISLVLFSLYQRYERTKTFAPEFMFFAPISLIAVALVATYFGFTSMLGVYTGIIIFVCVGGRLHMRMFQVNASLEVITQSSDQHIQNILTFDHRTMLMLGLILVGFILVLNTFVITPMLGLIPRINPAHVEITPDQIELDMFVSTLNQGAMGIPPELADLSEPFVIWQILEWIVLYIGMPIFGLILLYFMLIKIRKLFKLWGKRENIENKLNDEFADIKEFIRKPKAQNKWWLRGREHRIRRLFRETIIRHIKKGVPIVITDTPNEMTEKINIEDIATLTEDYAAVRYRQINDIS